MQDTVKVSDLEEISDQDTDNKVDTGKVAINVDVDMTKEQEIYLLLVY